MINLVTVKNKIPLYKGEEPANTIELLEFEELDFGVVRQKGLSEVGEQLIFIHPDFCIPDVPMFESYIRPNGDEKKSKLGSNNRIKAIKFNLHVGDGLPVYSQGIVLSQSDLSMPLTDCTVENLGITKWTEPDERGNVRNGASRPWPSFLYKTDEDRIETIPESKFIFTEDEFYTGRLKVDGSSITLFYVDGRSGICSRNQEKPLTYEKVTGRRNPTLLEKIRMFLFNYKPDLLIKETVESDSDFVVIGKPYLKQLVKYCQQNNVNLALRGELCGEGLKGSGNKNNPHAKLPKQILFYGIDEVYYGISKRVSPEKFSNIINEIGFETCEQIFRMPFSSKGHIRQVCDDYFKHNLVEGIVVRNSSNTISTKVMNPEYDSKK